MAGRLVRRLAAGTTMSALVLASVGGSAAPAQAGLLDSLLGTVTSVTTATTDLVSGTLESLLGPTGWIVDDGVTELSHVASVIGADRLYSRGVTGKGVGVALVDTGVVPVKGLTSGNVGERAGPVVREPVARTTVPGHLRPRHAHGRHHRRQATRRPAGGSGFQGIAPGARLTSIKVGTSDGRRRRVAGGRRHRLGRGAPQRRPGQPDPGAQPLVRHGRRAGLPPRPADPRGGERLARRHRGRRGRRQQRHRQPEARTTPRTTRTCSRSARPTPAARSTPPTTWCPRSAAAVTPRDGSTSSPPAGRSCRCATRAPTSTRRTPTARVDDATSRAAARRRPPPSCPAQWHCSWRAGPT